MKSNAIEAWLAFSNAVSIMRNEFSHSLRAHELSLMEFRILRHLCDNGSTSMAKLADELMITKAGITLLTDRLEDRKLVRRVRREGDRRLIFITVTAGGKRKFACARKDYDSLIERRLGRLDESELETFTNVVGKLGEGEKISSRLAER